jgi:hypothetical protein
MLTRQGKHPKPRRVLHYGVHGIGKSTWANQPGVCFVDIEDGLGDIEVHNATDRMRSFADVTAFLSYVRGNNSQLGFKAIAIDTIDALERLIWQQVAQDNGKAKIEDIGYGKGYKMAVDKWMFLLESLMQLRDLGLTIILLAHAKVTEFKNPEGDSYDRYEPDLHDLASSLIQEWCDEVLFSSYRTFTKSEDMGFNKTRAIGVGGKERFIRTTHSAVAQAKNRLRMPDEIPFDFWGIKIKEADGTERAIPGFGHYLPKITPPASPAAAPPPATAPTTSPVETAQPPQPSGNIAGIVTEGSSKQPQPTSPETNALTDHITRSLSGAA